MEIWRNQFDLMADFVVMPILLLIHILVTWVVQLRVRPLTPAKFSISFAIFFIIWLALKVDVEPLPWLMVPLLVLAQLLLVALAWRYVRPQELSGWKAFAICLGLSLSNYLFLQLIMVNLWKVL